MSVCLLHSFMCTFSLFFSTHPVGPSWVGIDDMQRPWKRLSATHRSPPYLMTRKFWKKLFFRHRSALRYHTGHRNPSRGWETSLSFLSHIYMSQGPSHVRFTFLCGMNVNASFRAHTRYKDDLYAVWILTYSIFIRPLRAKLITHTHTHTHTHARTLGRAGWIDEAWTIRYIYRFTPSSHRRQLTRVRAFSPHFLFINEFGRGCAHIILLLTWTFVRDWGCASFW